MTSQQPFTTKVIAQFMGHFRYDLIWDKELVSGFLNAKRQPLRRHEVILVFGSPKCYNPQMSKGKPLHSVGSSAGSDPKLNRNYGKFKINSDARAGSTDKYPTSIIHLRKPHPSIAVHPTEKPVELMEYLMRTYTNEGDTVLDPFMGSGTTGVAARNLNRNFIGIEMDPKYFEIAKNRI
jgi:site-specific DNA-methyltransferase (adenine-specific)